MLLQEILDGVEADFLDFLDRVIFQTTFVSEKYNGNDNTSLTLRQFPVTAVTLLKIDEVTIPQAQTAIDFGWSFDEDTIYIQNGAGAFQDVRRPRVGRFIRGAQNVEITYTAGLAVGDAELKKLILASRRQAAHEYRGRDWIGQKTKSLGSDQSISLDMERWAPGVLGALQSSKNVSPIL